MMNRFNLDYCQWLLILLLKKLGVWGIVGLVLFLASLIFQFSTLQHLKQTIADSQREFQSKQSQHLVDAKIDIAPQNHAEEIQHFYDKFPAATQLPEILSAINALARKHQLALNRGEYRMNEIRTSKNLIPHELKQYQIVLPITGPYANIRIFIAEVLHEVPNLALIDMQLKRDSTLNPNVEANLEFVLFVKAESWK